jgi:hypothetical protein
MKEVKQQRIRRRENARHDPEWEAVFRQDFPEIPDDLFSREN